jgi:hypothetical protein
MVLNLPLNFSILLKELLIAMVYMGVEVIAYSGIYGDGVKDGVTISICH